MTAVSAAFRNADLDGRRGVDVRVDGGVVAEIGTGLMSPAEVEVDCGGGALLPGLHDHHLHLLATAAASDSVACGPPEVRCRADLRRALCSAAPRDGWIRGVGFDDGAVGDLDRDALDEMRPEVPVRVQHRSGALWVVNTAAAEALGLAGQDAEGIERDAAGRPSGRLWRLDRWLRERLGPAAVPDLAGLGRRLCAYGITGVTDATPGLTPGAVELLGGGALPQRVMLLGDPAGTAPWKIVVADHDLPAPGELQALIGAVRPRPVALHCVSRAALVIAAAALRDGGTVPGDRIEHAAVCPPDLAAMLAALGVTVVTQPSLLARRGDEYLDRVEPQDVPFLWPFASLVSAGVAVACSSDAPYGELDPWQAVVAARDRIAPSGRAVGPGERVRPAAALAGFLTSPEAPGGVPRRIQVGAAADLVMLDRPLADTLRDPAADHVRLTMIGGRVVYVAGAAVPA
jgi:predicted amidohydrolase YtcJ